MKKPLKIAAALLLTALVMALAVTAFSQVRRAGSAEDIRQLTEALRRGAVACYAQEGFYPPDADFLLEYSGIHYDPDRYWIHYEIFASNLMPDITVIEKRHEK